MQWKRATASRDRRVVGHLSEEGKKRQCVIAGVGITSRRVRGRTKAANADPKYR